MLYIDNLCEFVRLVIENEERGVFWPQNSEYVDTCEVVRQVAKETGHKIWITKLLNPFVVLGALFIPAFSKVWGTLVYEKELIIGNFAEKQPKDWQTSIHETANSQLV